jgi:hypothetical protein
VLLTADYYDADLAERYGWMRRVIDLPEPTQRLLLLAAAGPLGDAVLVWRAADRLSIEPTSMAPATEAGLLEIDDDRTVSASAGALSGVLDRVGRRWTSASTRRAWRGERSGVRR